MGWLTDIMGTLRPHVEFQDRRIEKNSVPHLRPHETVTISRTRLPSQAGKEGNSNRHKILHFHPFTECHYRPGTTLRFLPSGVSKIPR